MGSGRQAGAAWTTAVPSPVDLRHELLDWLAGGPQVGDGADKDQLREMHAEARLASMARRFDFLRGGAARFGPYLARGAEVDPHRIDPVLVSVRDGHTADLYRWVRLMWWSLPYSKGYGRRMKFLVFDRQNGKLMGLLGFQSPPVDVSARDTYLGLHKLSGEQKTYVLNQSLDIYTLGAVPPYNMLLGGKLLALLACSDEVREYYRALYRDSLTWLAGRRIPPRLLFLTTHSAFGRSSQYSRLKFRGELVGWPLGYTRGSGTFHFPESIYRKLRAFLRDNGYCVETGYGFGPRRRLQLICTALGALGLSRSLVYHGVQREVYLFPLVSNLLDVIHRGAVPAWRSFPFAELVSWWRERWALPRAGRIPGWREWQPGPWVAESLARVQAYLRQCGGIPDGDLP